MKEVMFMCREVSTQSEFTGYIENMTDDSKKLYIKNRLVEQIIWYDKKARHNQIWYKALALISFIFTSLIPCIAILSQKYSKLSISFIIAILGCTTSIITAILSLFEHQKLWIQYRFDCELLKGLFYRYIARAEEFCNLSEEDAFQLLVSNTEKCIQREFMSWNQLSHTCNNNDNQKTK